MHDSFRSLSSASLSAPTLNYIFCIMKYTNTVPSNDRLRLKPCAPSGGGWDCIVMWYARKTLCPIPHRTLESFPVTCWRLNAPQPWWLLSLTTSKEQSYLHFGCATILSIAADRNLLPPLSSLPQPVLQRPQPQRHGATSTPPTALISPFCNGCCRSQWPCSCECPSAAHATSYLKLHWQQCSRVRETTAKWRRKRRLRIV